MRHAATEGWAIALPLALASAISVPLMLLGGDQVVADTIYSLQGSHWLARDAWITSTVLHDWGKKFSALCWIGVAIAWCLTWTGSVDRSWRKPISYLLATTLLATAVVSAMKHQTNMDCPWDLLRYGGTRIEIGILEHRPDQLGKAACFPAGHASAGYGWVASFFAFSAVAPRWRWWGLSFGLVLGAVFGIAQQFRGAHFLSHDLWTLTISWTTACLSARLWLKPEVAKCHLSPRWSQDGRTHPMFFKVEQ